MEEGSHLKLLFVVLLLAYQGFRFLRKLWKKQREKALQQEIDLGLRRPEDLPRPTVDAEPKPPSSLELPGWDDLLSENPEDEEDEEKPVPSAKPKSPPPPLPAPRPSIQAAHSALRPSVAAKAVHHAGKPILTRAGLRQAMIARILLEPPRSGLGGIRRERR